MTITAFDGPIVSFGVTQGSSIQMTYNEERGPSLLDLGSALLDPRMQRYGFGYQPGQGVGNATFGFYGGLGIVDAVPSATSSNNIAASQSATASGGSALTLNTTGSGITYNPTFYATETSCAITGLLAIDGLAGGSTGAGVAFGTGGTVNIWNPASMISRCLSIIGSSDDSSGIFTIRGYDVYGFAMTESIVGGNAAAVVTQKAFKYVASITSCGTVNSTGVIVGTATKFGFPLRVDSPGYLSGWYGQGSSALPIAVSTGIAYASTRATQTSTTPDVRGTITLTPASTGGQRVFMTVMPSVANLATITSTNYSGLFGATQA